MHRPRLWQALRRTGCGLCIVLAVVVLPSQSSASDPTRRETLRFAVRRAALELGAARPEAAALALRRVQPDPRAGRPEQEVALLWAEAEYLAGNTALATRLWLDLATTSDAFVRAQAAAHRMALAAATADTTGAVLAHRFLQEADGYSGSQRREVGAGFVLAAMLLQRHGEASLAAEALSDAPGAARAVAQLLEAEAALDRGDSKRAEDLYRDAQRRAASAADDDSLAAWIEAAAQLGRARALHLGGDAVRAREILATPPRIEPLGQYARLLDAEIAYAAGELDDAARTLGGSALQRHDAVHAGEAALLAVQVELDRGNFAAAESLAAGLVRDLPQWLDAASVERLPAELRLDLHAWHLWCTRTTLDMLVGREALRHTLRRTHLDAAAVLRIDTPIAADTSTAAWTLLQPYRHGAVILESETDYRRTAVHLQSALAELRRAANGQRAAAAGLAARRELLDRAAAAMAAHAAALAALQRATSELEAALAAYRQALTAQEAGWQRLLAARLGALRTAVATLERGTARLEARYPQDRSVRTNEETARARRAVEAAHEWIAAVDSLERDVASRVEAQVHAVLHQRSPDAAAAALAALQRRVTALLDATATLQRELEAADAAERAALAAADAAWRDADGAARSARDDAVAARLGFAAAVSRILAARRAAYVEAASAAGATAAFLGAIADTSGVAVRMARWEHAAARLDAFVQQYPRARRADEALYRLGEAHVRRAGLAHQMALATAGAEANAGEIALPVDIYADAIAVYARLLSEHPASTRVADTHFQLGFLYAEMGSPEVSSAHLQDFLQRAAPDDSRRGRAALCLGENLVFLGDLDAAFAAYTEATAGIEEETRALARLKLAWCAYELDRLDAARGALRDLLAEAAAGGTTSTGLQPEALESLALCFAADHRAREAAQVLDTWGRPPYDFALLQRVAALFAARAHYDEAIDADRVLLERHPRHPFAPAVALDEIHLVEIRQGEAAAHALAAERAALFAPGGAWAQAARDTLALVAPAWQSRSLEEDRGRARADSLARALADPPTAAAHMARRLRSAAVYAHQQGASAEDATQLQRAVELYRRTLELFPGAEDEPKTWLYLGEALFALDQHGAAADAYATAAAHAMADSSTQVTAARSELAALDQAAAADPQWLDRFAAVTQQFVAKAPQDPHGHDALERVGELAFAAARYEQAQAAYAELATRTPEPRRAVTALKAVGDTWWQRQDYARAADGYDTALRTARTSGDDSLTQVLAVLAPSALFRAAETAAARQHPDEAAQLFERLVDTHVDFASNDQALYRAARLRAASGDTARALAHYTRLVDAHPGSSLHPDALLELAGLHAAHGERTLAATNYGRFADRHADHPQAGAARLRAAELYAADGNRDAADAAYATLVTRELTAARPDSVLVGQLSLRRARLAADAQQALPHYTQALGWGRGLAPAERGEAAFHVAEARRSSYENVPLDPPLATSLQQKKEALEATLTAYAVVLQNPVEPWHAAACLRVGECLTHLGDALATSPPPTEFAAAEASAYRQALAAQADALEERAVSVWSEGLRGARGAATEDSWTNALESRLHPVLARRVPLRPEPFFVVVQP